MYKKRILKGGAAEMTRRFRALTNHLCPQFQRRDALYKNRHVYKLK